MTWARQWGRGEASSSWLGPSRPRSSQVVVWKRYSDFRKLHGDLAYTHRNLFRRLEEFPAFPRAQVFGECVWAVRPERVGELGTGTLCWWRPEGQGGHSPRGHSWAGRAQSSERPRPDGVRP